MVAQARGRTGERQRLIAQVATWATCVVATGTFLLATALGHDPWTAMFRAAVVAVATRIVSGLLAGPVIAVVLDALAADHATRDDPTTPDAGGPR